MKRLPLAAAIAASVLFASSGALAAGAPAGLSVETTPILTLLANPTARPILMSDWPGLDNIHLMDVAGQSMRSLESRPEAGLDDTLLGAIQAKFDAAVSQRHSAARISSPPVPSP